MDVDLEALLGNSDAAMDVDFEATMQSSNSESGQATLLGSLPKGRNVAVITMTGSCCPVTQAHIQCFIEARRLVLGGVEPRPKKMERFDEALCFLSLNSDSHVSSKLSGKGLPHIHYEDRGHLVELATEGLPWMAFNRARENHACERLAKEWPHLNFVRFALNGADDVLKYQKWNGCSNARRFITMGRPGATQKLHTAVRRARIDPDLGWFMIGPELPDISSTAVRTALGDGDTVALERLLHPAVAKWCLTDSPYQTQNSEDSCEVLTVFQYPMSLLMPKVVNASMHDPINPLPESLHGGF